MTSALGFAALRSLTSAFCFACASRELVADEKLAKTSHGSSYWLALTVQTS